jgi:hypothetical protein
MSLKKEKLDEMPTCGIIMPISTIDNCGSEHWVDVLSIIKEVCTINNFKSDLVSDGHDVGVIQNRIVENIYTSDIVICDVSCKNANVMFELGMRLAFDKPTIIIKDDQTGYCFDTGVIEHIEYPRDLRFNKINSFKELLGKKLVATFEKSKADPQFSTFLKHFGKYKIAHLDEIEITSENFILKAIDDLKREVRSIRNVSIHGYDENRNANGKSLGRGIGIDTNSSRLVFKQIVQDFMKQHNISLPPDEMEMLIPDMIQALNNNPTLLAIAGNDKNFEKLVRDSIYS